MEYIPDYTVWFNFDSEMSEIGCVKFWQSMILLGAANYTAKDDKVSFKLI